MGVGKESTETDCLVTALLFSKPRYKKFSLSELKEKNLIFIIIQSQWNLVCIYVKIYKFHLFHTTCQSNLCKTTAFENKWHIHVILGTCTATAQCWSFITFDMYRLVKGARWWQNFITRHSLWAPHHSIMMVVLLFLEVLSCCK